MTITVEECDRRAAIAADTGGDVCKTCLIAQALIRMNVPFERVRSRNIEWTNWKGVPLPEAAVRITHCPPRAWNTLELPITFEVPHEV